MAPFAAATAILFLVGCSDDENPLPVPPGGEEKEAPAIRLEKVSEDSESISFRIAAENAEKAAYVVLAGDQSEPGVEAVLQNGKAVGLTAANTYVESGLTPSTSYTVVVAAANEQKSCVERLVMRTAMRIDASYQARHCMAIYYGNRYVSDKSLYNYYFVLSDVGFDDSNFVNPNGEFFFRIDLFNTQAEDPKNAFIPEGVYTFDGTSDEPGMGLMGRKSGFFRTDEYSFHTDKHDFRQATLTVARIETGWRYEVLATLDNDEIYYVEYEGPVVFDNQSNDGVVGQQLPPLDTDLSATFTYGEGNISYQEGKLSQVDMTFTDMAIDGSSLVPPGNVLYATFITEVQNGKLPETTFRVEGEADSNFFVPGEEVEQVTGFYVPSFTCAQVVQSASDKKTGYCTGGTVAVARSENGYRFDFNLQTLDGHHVTATYDGPFAIYGPGNSMLAEDCEVSLPDIGATAWFYGDEYNTGNGYWKLTISPGWGTGGAGDGLLFSFFTEDTEYTPWLESHTFTITDTGEPYTAIPGDLVNDGGSVRIVGTNYVKYENYQIVAAAPLRSGTFTLTKCEDGYYTLQFECLDDSGHTVRGTWNNQLYPSDKTPSTSVAATPAFCPQAVRLSSLPKGAPRAAVLSR